MATYQETQQPARRATVPLDVVGAHRVLDPETLADLLHEGLVEAQRTRGVDPQTTWFDAAAAAELLLQHVTNLTQTGPAETTSAFPQVRG